ncbi:hypothetical protein XCR1_1060045 [Xenorhabdus cabanillasii JM26]|uniref:Uncharacterized protein n=1 Tax=Xenorhabdus cabanillasii JM26 TaxID=1427517 RepID=W1IL74_9GAMM|nr:hypothetical protein XCR1_1060045 [Xenorhabdus cabanillasii JM26]
MEFTPLSFTCCLISVGVDKPATEGELIKNMKGSKDILVSKRI